MEPPLGILKTTPEAFLQTTPVRAIALEAAIPAVTYKNAKQRRYEERGARRVEDRKRAKAARRAEKRALLGLPDDCEEQPPQVTLFSNPHAENRVVSTAQDDSSLATQPNSLSEGGGGENASEDNDKSFQSSFQNPLPIVLLAVAAPDHSFQPTHLLSVLTSEMVDVDTMRPTELSAPLDQYGEAVNEPQNASTTALITGWTDPTVDCADLADMLWQDEDDCVPVYAGMEEQTQDNSGTLDPASYDSGSWPKTHEVEQPNADEHEQRWREVQLAEDHVSVWDSSLEREVARLRETNIDHIVWGASSDSDTDTDTDRSESSGVHTRDPSDVRLTDISTFVPGKSAHGEQHQVRSSENLDQSKSLVKDAPADFHPTYDYGKVNPTDDLCKSCKNILAANRNHCKHGLYCSYCHSEHQLSVERRYDLVRIRL